MDELRINDKIEVKKLAALDQSKIVNLKDENKEQNAHFKTEEEANAKRTAENRKVSVEELVERANQYVNRFSTKISFYYDPERKISKILVTEKGTGKVIRQIPPEQMVDLMDKLEEIAGIIYNGRA
ncbi:flagellar protein FlaG [Caldithrix abyssi]|uniref:Flagellar protein FlaG n=1 Tax=Caldithrix abyssi DSM 13497 TaxID=880073 RepID=H1XP99_CALAY|nr:flagellar protein FlaG [Caldithrix abyssi]APF18186.1 flagellar protein FlaG [Caldithrix abyssi DSM 13497]EHO42214.1 flagellar protein FlaG protein [Caldithrix abyssi DSM 13497]